MRGWGTTSRVRVLVVITSGFGHIRPSAPIAAAARRRGHEVRYVVSSRDRLMAGNSRGSGAIAPAEFTTGLGFQTDIVEPVDITSLLDRLPGPESDGAAMMRGFFLRAAAAGPFIRSLAEQWRPDVILRDTAGQDAWAVAELLDTPLATFDFAPALSGMTQQVAAGELTWFRHEMGLPADPEFERLHSQLTIIGAPPTWFDGHHLPANTHFVQPVEPDPLPGESIAGVLDDEDRRPLVYVTFGTAFNTPDLFQACCGRECRLSGRAGVCLAEGGVEGWSLGIVACVHRIDPRMKALSVSVKPAWSSRAVRSGPVRALSPAPCSAWRAFGGVVVLLHTDDDPPARPEAPGASPSAHPAVGPRRSRPGSGRSPPRTCRPTKAASSRRLAAHRPSLQRFAAGAGVARR